jgi:hypothetical protein
MLYCAARPDIECGCGHPSCATKTSRLVWGCLRSARSRLTFSSYEPVLSIGKPLWCEEAATGWMNSVLVFGRGTEVYMMAKTEVPTDSIRFGMNEGARSLSVFSAFESFSEHW